MFAHLLVMFMEDFTSGHDACTIKLKFLSGVGTPLVCCSCTFWLSWSVGLAHVCLLGLTLPKKTVVLVFFSSTCIPLLWSVCTFDFGAVRNCLWCWGAQIAKFPELNIRASRVIHLTLRGLKYSELKLAEHILEASELLVGFSHSYFVV